MVDVMSIKLCDLEGQLRRETDKAFFVYFTDMGVEVWVPKSQVEYDGDKTFTMPEWLAIDKGLV